MGWISLDRGWLWLQPTSRRWRTKIRLGESLSAMMGGRYSPVFSTVRPGVGNLGTLYVTRASCIRGSSEAASRCLLQRLS